MISGHIHVERGEYTLEWIYKFVDTAETNGIDEIWLLEHCYHFKEFVPNVLITDWEASEEDLSLFDEQGIEVIIVDKPE